ncbi:DUF4167 domain-containing protein [Sphingobium sp. HBC34]|uniref:DUF4167 domain-containing protein n=1 Tax=Sphingobium cyanobacteriorum TaxID=3063954 RepID=A0ABT8ZN11_9SPHN|nr:DUF4167 domain-containing protein [Sphingobium sp. HBC34]MDO7835861.1 DUF4167 domain-containing protein [Sphingobium sp. HBC34]
MINNRQAGRRNRGRNNNNGRPNGNNNRGGGDNGNRIDNRARGNATQLLEKYRNMARDAQMVGDRVNAEYYLQFADHYFRVLADNRARQEEQQPRPRNRDENFDQDGEDFDGGYDGGDDFRGDQSAYDRTPREQERRPEEGRDNRDLRGESRNDNRDARAEGRAELREPRSDNREPRGEGRSDRDMRGGNRDLRDGANNPRRDRPRRDRFVSQELGVEGPAGTPAEDRAPAPQRPAPQHEVQPQPVVQAAPEAEAETPRPRRGRPRKAAPVEAAESFDVAVLPPSIARADNDAEPAADEAPKKRTRRPRATTTEAAE